MSPCDWDMESHCCADGCHAPATHERLSDFTNDGTPVVELVCCEHAEATP